jgi:hypothetical protein
MKSNRHDEHSTAGQPNEQTGEDALKTEERSLDIGESGQFAPGGYYNQQGAIAPDRHTLDDEDIVPPGRR